MYFIFRGRRTASLLALSFLILGLVGGNAFAQSTTYSYSGNTYDFADAPYTTADRLSGSFTTASPLGPNFSGDASGLVTALSFDDGVEARTLANTTLCQFDIATNANGEVIDWSIFLRQSDTGPTENQHSIESYATDTLAGPGLDLVGFDSGTGTTDCSSIALSPTASADQVPSDPWLNTGPSFAVSVPTLSFGSILLMLLLISAIGLRAAFRLD